MKTSTIILLGVGAYLLLSNKAVASTVDVSPTAIQHATSDYITNGTQQQSDALIAITDELKREGANNLDVYNKLVANYNATLPSTIISTIPSVIPSADIVSNIPIYVVTQAVRDSNGQTALDRQIATNKLSQTPAQSTALSNATALATAWNKANGY